MGSWGLSPGQRRSIQRLCTGWSLGYCGEHADLKFFKGEEREPIEGKLFDALLRKGIIERQGDVYELAGLGLEVAESIKITGGEPK